MASAQVDAAQVEEFPKSSEETTIGSPTIEAPAKAPATQNIESPYDEDDDKEVSLPDELGKEGRLDDKENQKALEPQLIDLDEDDEDENAEDEEPALNSTGGSINFSEEEGDKDEK